MSQSSSKQSPFNWKQPAGQALDVVNVEVGAAVSDTQREVIFVVEAARVSEPWTMAVIVAVGADEGRFVGPTIEPRRP